MTVRYIQAGESRVSAAVVNRPTQDLATEVARRQTDRRRTQYTLAKELGLTPITGADQLVQMPGTVTNLHGFKLIRGRLYGSESPHGTGLQGRFVRFNNLEDLSDFTVVDFPGTPTPAPAIDAMYKFAYCPGTNRIYGMCNSGRFFSMDIDTLALTEHALGIDLAGPLPNSPWSETIEADDTYIYVIGFSSPDFVTIKTRIYRFLASNLAAPPTLLEIPGRHTAHASVIANGKLFLEGAWNNVSDASKASAWLARVDLATFTLEQHVNLAGHPWLAAKNITVAGSWLFVGTEGTNGPNLYRVNSMDLTQQLVVTTGVYAQYYSAFFDGRYVWAICNGITGTLVRIEPETMQVAQCTTPEAVQAGAWGFDILSDGERFFVHNWQGGEVGTKVARFAVPKAEASRFAGSSSGGAAWGVGAKGAGHGRMTTAEVAGIHNVGGGIRMQALATPAAPTVFQTVGTPATTTRTYYIVAVDAFGKRSLVSPALVATNQPDTLGTVPAGFSALQWSHVDGAVTYDVLRGDTATKIGSTPANRFVDYGQSAGTAYVAPTRNETADVTIDGFLSVATATGDGTVQQYGISAAMTFTPAPSQGAWTITPVNSILTVDGPNNAGFAGLIGGFFQVTLASTRTGTDQGTVAGCRAVAIKSNTTGSSSGIVCGLNSFVNLMAGCTSTNTFSAYVTGSISGIATSSAGIFASCSVLTGASVTNHRVIHISKPAVQAGATVSTILAGLYIDDFSTAFSGSVPAAPNTAAIYVAGGLTRLADLTMVGKFTVGAGDALTFYNATTAQDFSLRRGTAGSPDTSANPLVKIERTVQGNSANWTGDGVEAMAGLVAITKGTSINDGQTVGVAGLALNSSVTPASPGGDDACGLYGVGRITGSGTGTGIGLFVLGRRDTDTGSACGAEIDAGNYTATPATYNSTGFSRSLALWMNATGDSESSVGIALGNAFGRQFQVGIAFVGQVNNSLTGPASVASIRDDGNAATSILINGTHATASIAIANGAGTMVIGATSVQQAGTLALEVIGNTSDITNALAVFGSLSGSRAHIVEFRNSVGRSSWCIAGSANQHLTGTVAGDAALRPQTTGKSLHIGGTLRVVSVTQDNKLGFFAATPVAQPSNTTDLRQALIDLGLYASGGATPLSLNGGTLSATIAILGGGSQLLSPTLLEVNTGTNSDPVVLIHGTGSTTIMSFRVGNASGHSKWFAAGGSGQFLTGTAAGDTGVQVVTSTKQYHVGGTTKVLTVTQDNKFAFFAATPVAQQAANADTSGATLAALETEVNEVKAVLRAFGQIAP